AQGDSAAATAWLLDVTSSAPDPARVLGDLVDVSWIPLERRALIYQRILGLNESALGKLDGLERQNAEQEFASWQVRWIRYLVHSKQYADAASAIAALSQETKDAQSRLLVPLELQAAARLGNLDSILAAYNMNPQKTPPLDVLRVAARQLFEADDKQSARKILEMVFAREINEHKLVAANFLGLAEIRLASGDTAGALDLLRRLVVAVGNPFENLDPAAALLEKTNHNAEAVEFLEQLVKSATWDASYRLRLAKAKLAAGRDQTSALESLSSIASAANASYDLRLNAASALGGRTHQSLGSGELDLLAGSGAVNFAAADKFYFYEARMKAAEQTTDVQAKMQLLSHCVIDFPRRDASRVPLFQAAVGAQSDGYALGILEPILQTPFLRNPASPVINEEEQIASSGDESGGEEESQGGANSVGAAGAQLSRAQQAHFAQMIADAMSRAGRSSDALSYYQTARHSENSPAVRKTLAARIAAVKSALSAERENASRQPLLHEALEQDRVVRPRLLARVDSASRSAKGGQNP
ncbi:MAG: hypothetical protein WCB05_04285, partial [Candidatus Sulfotelmatobacter sp.]